MAGTSRASRAAAVTLLALGVLGVTGGAAMAAPSAGNNGTVKIHEVGVESSPARANDPHVCGFHLHLFGLDALQKVSFEITGGGAVALTDTLVADAAGEAQSSDYTLSDGHYKLAVDTGDDQPGLDKHKVFKVDCDAGGPDPTDPTDPTDPEDPVIVT